MDLNVFEFAPISASTCACEHSAGTTTNRVNSPFASAPTSLRSPSSHYSLLIYPPPYIPPPPAPVNMAFFCQVRSGTSTNSFMMVDSPGMIDSPMSRTSIYNNDLANPDSSGRRQGSDTSRGYDFEGVVRWFAERADVILLFFDPDKPGTTGETLSILTNALPGMDHKLYIVLNKVW